MSWLTRISLAIVVAVGLTATSRIDIRWGQENFDLASKGAAPAEPLIAEFLEEHETSPLHRALPIDFLSTRAGTRNKPNFATALNAWPLGLQQRNNLYNFTLVLLI